MKPVAGPLSRTPIPIRTTAVVARGRRLQCDKRDPGNRQSGSLAIPTMCPTRPISRNPDRASARLEANVRDASESQRATSVSRIEWSGIGALGNDGSASRPTRCPTPFGSRPCRRNEASTARRRPPHRDRALSSRHRGTRLGARDRLHDARAAAVDLSTIQVPTVFEEGPWCVAQSPACRGCDDGRRTPGTIQG